MMQIDASICISLLCTFLRSVELRQLRKANQHDTHEDNQSSQSDIHSVLQVIRLDRFGFWLPAGLKFYREP